jgi:hypothetical protein
MSGKWLHEVYTKRTDPYLCDFFETTKWAPESFTVHHLRHFLDVVKVVSEGNPRYPELHDEGLLTMLVYLTDAHHPPKG